MVFNIVISQLLIDINIDFLSKKSLLKKLINILLALF